MRWQSARTPGQVDVDRVGWPRRRHLAGHAHAPLACRGRLQGRSRRRADLHRCREQQRRGVDLGIPGPRPARVARTAGTAIGRFAPSAISSCAHVAHRAAAHGRATGDGRNADTDMCAWDHAAHATFRVPRRRGQGPVVPAPAAGVRRDDDPASSASRSARRCTARPPARGWPTTSCAAPRRASSAWWSASRTRSPTTTCDGAERNAVAQLRELAPPRGALPMVFVRVRTVDQIPMLVAALGDARRVSPAS